MTSPHARTAEGYRRISIDPVTRLEGHGKIDIFLDKDGNVADCFFQVPELRGFEKFCEGRPVEELPRITPRICGVCPEAHHMASAKACDAVYHVDPPRPPRSSGNCSTPPSMWAITHCTSTPWAGLTSWSAPTPRRPTETSSVW